MKALSGADVVPGCSARLGAADDDGLLAAVEARADHGRAPGVVALVLGIADR